MTQQLSSNRQNFDFSRHFDNIMISRNDSLDFVKGCLVVGMVLYHCINYSFQEMQTIRYISFITGAFILMAGFMISHIYLNRQGDLRKTVANRLFTRGLKLILIFIVLNIGISIFVDKSQSGKEFNITLMLENYYPIFIAGHTRLAAFDILLPIAYLLISMSLIIRVANEKYRFLIIFVISILLLTICSLQFYDNTGGYNIRFLTIGFCGTVCGFMHASELEIYIRYKTAYLFGLYALILLIIMIYRIYYPLYVAYVIVNILLLYIIGMHVRKGNMMFSLVSQLGRYSLFSYIIQIAILQIIYKIINLSSSWSQVFVSFVMTTIIMIFTVNAMNLLQAKYEGVRKIYGLVFR